MAQDIEHLNFALVEDKRPPMYTAMKYWGKKPHNIWGEFIKTYCPPNGVVLDPFAGSAISAFEAIKIGRKAWAFDLNPLTSFMIEVLSSKLDEDVFMAEFNKIVATVANDTIYKKHYIRQYSGKKCVICNYRWLSHRAQVLYMHATGLLYHEGNCGQWWR